MKHRKLIACITAVFSLLTWIIPVSASNQTQLTTAETDNVFGTDTGSYTNYLENLPENSTLSDVSFTVDLSNYTTTEGHAAVAKENSEYPFVIVLTDEGYIEWLFEVPQTGLYNISMDYLPTEGKGSTASRKLTIDGMLPFSECGNLLFYRSYTNANDISVNEQGDEVRPSQIEKPMWLHTVLRDATGYYQDPLKFYLTAGKHKLRLDAVREPLTIGRITFGNATALPTYEQYLLEYEQAGYSTVEGERIEIQGESATLKSDSMIYPISDASTCAVQPSSAEHQLLNTIGGSKWQTVGQWLEWDFTVRQSGLYRLAIVAKQDIQSGQPSCRRLYIDGKVPFAEMDAIRFEYDTAYRVYALGGEDPYLFYLEEGTHTLRLEVTIGELADVVEQINTIVSQLNQTYRNMLMLMGSSPDVNRDYQLEELIPDDLENLSLQTQKLESVKQQYEELTGQNGAQLQILHNSLQLLKRMCKQHNKIPKLFSSFADTITSLGNWVTTARCQPLQVDYLLFDSPDEVLPSASASFGSEVLFNVQKFVYSFIRDYQTASISHADGSITVWVSSGRDQSSALNQMIKDQFTPQSGIGVNLQLVPAGTLLMATVAGKGPDVALGISQTDTINYAIRGASVDLTEMDGYQEVMSWFQESAIEPLSYEGAWYGVPETQTFFVLFYRKDILEDLQLSVPETWDDVYDMLPLLQQNNMTIGLPPVLQTYAMMLYQRGGKLYSEDNTTCLIDSSEGIEAFDAWVKLYTEYGLPVEYDFATRFRSGEMPLGIVDYGTYNMMSAFAPELEGVWGIAKVPGIRQEDGSVDHTTSGVVTATILLSSSKVQSQAWEFIRWWSNVEAQTKYGNELESILGTTGRYQPANKESLYSIPWDTASFNLLTEQWKETRAIPEIPGSYMTSRYIDFAYKKYAVDTGVSAYLQDSGQLMIDAANSINAELAAKLKEFHLLEK